MEAGSTFSSVSRLLDSGSVAADWLLFKTHKLAMPRPGEWQTLVMDTRVYVPEDMRAVLEQREVARMLAILQQPVLMMVQHVDRNYTLGSGWAFQGGLPEQDGGVNKRFTGVVRIRFMLQYEDKKTVNTVSCEVRPGLVAFLRTAEVDGRFNKSVWGVLDKETEKFLAVSTSVARRECDNCRMLDVACDPEACDTSDQAFESLWARRMKVKEGSGFTHLDMEYLSLLYANSSWSICHGPGKPIKAVVESYRNGPLFEVALVSVVQDEVLGIHPPRSSFRTVKYVREAVEYVLGNEEGEESLIKQEAILGMEEGSAIESGSPGMNASADDSWSSSRHGREARVACDHCSLKFKSSWELERHRRGVHLKRRDFKCSACGKNFSQQGHVNEHIRVVHSRANLQECKQCGKGFGAMSKLRRHVLTVHEKARNFHCKLCGQSYKERPYLKRHMLNQHGEKMP
uniref:C2H2-type domain-containing protein n=1 Tax=Rhodosorus marinus TaxID=101924 RepID=A0A7S2ZS91_9RHOD|mmetsp:Transcript_30863/g.118361  ORF Transcript_30863/g.118361 Transcript_30863/m.118361 type:complete len:457 (+) Transcript_30863:675-2045(+)|eukprot:CAMPEP_0113963598 /NCGR_PEP_ID=MMETSP0011_2-20120614/6605_1 /TAXON_ID=101924 /ORGANISM="Rhodosorus marinus" /LENGTH=456 /DNA_ID=CAMNT_0000975671 /DNA_START=160 /DNA_END=1530 /DNA_ORIENTATION=- /assembly_acc=CAM_ASM_000156